MCFFLFRRALRFTVEEVKAVRVVNCEALTILSRSDNSLLRQLKAVDEQIQNNEGVLPKSLCV